MNGVRFAIYILLKYYYFSKIYATIYMYRKSFSVSMKGGNHIYLTVKQQVKHLSKEDYITIKELCHAAKNLANEAIVDTPIRIRIA